MPSDETVNEGEFTKQTGQEDCPGRKEPTQRPCNRKLKVLGVTFSSLDFTLKSSELELLWVEQGGHEMCVSGRLLAAV